jgi:hypothetical protein
MNDHRVSGKEVGKADFKILKTVGELSLDLF